MTTPRVTELPQHLEPVEPDPFIDSRPRVAVAAPRLAERQARERRLELVRRTLRDGARNGSAARRTQRP
jgi:hypothetical protein